MRAALSRLRGSSARTLHICADPPPVHPPRALCLHSAGAGPTPANLHVGLFSTRLASATSAPGNGRLPATPAHGLGSPLRHRAKKRVRYRFICTGDWAHPSPHPHLDCADSSHVSTGTGTASATVGLRLRLAPCHICSGTALTPAGICTRTGLAPATSAPGLGSPLATSAPGTGPTPVTFCTRPVASSSPLRTHVWRVYRGQRRMRHVDQCSRRRFGEYSVHYPVQYPMQYREYESRSLQVQSNRSSPPRRPRRRHSSCSRRCSRRCLLRRSPALSPTPAATCGWRWKGCSPRRR